MKRKLEKLKFFLPFFLSIILISSLTMALAQSNGEEPQTVQGIFGNTELSSRFENLNTTLIQYGQNGYDYTTANTPYNLYLKANSNWGDGIKFSRVINETEYFIIYQTQDYSYRDVYGSQDYISPISNVQGIVENNSITYLNCFTNVNLTYEAQENIVKEHYVINQLPKTPAGYLTAPVTLDFGGYLKYGSLKIYVEGVEITGNFVTSKRIDFGLDANTILFYLPEPFTVDSIGNKTQVQYEVKKQGQQIWFYTRTPYVWLNNTSRIFPVYVDPTFGYEGIGEIGEIVNDVIRGSVFPIPGGGQAVSITAALKSYEGVYPGGHAYVRAAIYKHSDLSLVAYTSQVWEELSDDDYTWITMEFDSSPTLGVDVEYILTVHSTQTDYGGNVYLALSGGASNQGHFQSRDYYLGYPNTLTPTHDNNKYSIYCTYTNTVPTNDQLTLDLTGASYKGTKTLLAAKQDYKFVYKASDPNGATDISFAILILNYADRTVAVNVTRTSGDNWAFDEFYDPNNYITLNAGACTHSTSGNQKTFTFYVKINWNWGNSAETCSVQATVQDSLGQQDQDNYWNIFGVESTLTAYGLSVDTRVNPSQTLVFSGYWLYPGTMINPPDGDYQVKVKLLGVQKGSTDTTLVSGIFAISDVTAESSVTSYSYTVEATYMASAGSFAAVIVDKIKVISYTVSDPRATINDNVNIDVTLKYEYDNTAVTTGLITVNGFSATHQGSGVYRITRTSSSVTSVTYNTVGGWDSAYGLSTINQNSQSATVIWDSVTVYVSNPTNQRININTNASGIKVTGKYDFDSATFDGTFTMNNTQYQYSTAQRQGYTVSSISGGAHGITAISWKNTTYCIWDSLSINIVVSANRINVNTNASVNVFITRVFDSSTSNGVATLNYTTYTHSTPQRQGYTVNAVSGDTYGITTISTNDVDYVIWDNIKVISYTAADARVNIYDNVNIDATLKYGYDNTAITTGTITINGLTASHISSGVYRVTETRYSTNGTTYNTVAGSESTYGLNTVNQNSQSILVIWDRIILTNIGNDDSRRDVGSTGTIWATAKLEYDNHLLGSGDSLTISSKALSWNAGNNRFEGTDSKTTVQSVTYNTFTSGNEATYGITTGSMSGLSTTIIWDRVVVQINANVTSPDAGEWIDSSITAIYQFDSQTVSNPTINVNRNGTYYATGNFIDKLDSEGLWLYTTKNLTEPTYGLTAFSSNTLTVMWGNLFIEISQITVPDNRVPISSSAYAYFYCRFSSNQSAVSSGTLYVNTQSFSINSTGWAAAVFSSSAVTSQSLSVTNVNVNGETDYGQIPSNPTIIWDRVEVYQKGAVASRIEVAKSTIVWFRLRWEYDLVEFASGQAVSVSGASTTWNSTNSQWELQVSQIEVGSWNYVVSSHTDTQHGITILKDSVGAQTIIWDALKLSAVTINLPNDLVYVRMVFAYDNTPVEGYVSIAGLYGAQTNNTGWATFNFQTYSQIEHGLEAYPLSGAGFTLSLQNQTINYAKVTHAPFTLHSNNAIINPVWNSGTQWLTFNGSGTIIIDVGAYGIPTRVTVNGTTYHDWSYSASTQKLAINNVASAVGVYWEPPPTPTPAPPSEVPSGEAPPPATYTVTIRVMQGNIPVSGAMVTLGTQMLYTNASGYTTFAGIGAGIYPITVTVEGITAYSNQLVVSQDGIWLIDLARPQESPTTIITPPPAPAPSLIDILTTHWYIFVIIIGLIVLGIIEWRTKTPLIFSR